jgi:uncharacterized protein
LDKEIENRREQMERTEMECPVDGTKIETRTFEGVNVEECPQCGGLWFDKGEFRKAKDASEPDLSWLDFDLWSDHESMKADWSSRECPLCGKNMASISYAGTEVMVEYCTEEHGIWLDKGEFQAIIEALEAEVTTKDIPGYIASSLKEAGELLTGDEGFISEWKDFTTVVRFLQYRLLAENPKLAEFLVAFQSANPLK